MRVIASLLRHCKGEAGSNRFVSILLLLLIHFRLREYVKNKAEQTEENKRIREEVRRRRRRNRVDDEIEFLQRRRK